MVFFVARLHYKLTMSLNVNQNSHLFSFKNPSQPSDSSTYESLYLREIFTHFSPALSCGF